MQDFLFTLCLMVQWIGLQGSPRYELQIRLRLGAQLPCTHTCVYTWAYTLQRNFTESSIQRIYFQKRVNLA